MMAVNIQAELLWYDTTVSEVHAVCMHTTFPVPYTGFMKNNITFLLY
jgi:hypothetical protein